MASSLFLLLDDVSVYLKNASVGFKKITAMVPDATAAGLKSTIPVLADDLALNAEQVSGLQAKRELPVVAAIAKGSAKNKVYLLAGILGASVAMPALIIGGLIAGGAFLAYEGVHKVMESKDAILTFFKKPLMSKEEKQELKRKDAEEALKNLHEFASMTDEQLLAKEKDKIKTSIKTDLILSAEILVISLGAMSGLGLATQAMSLAAVAGIMTVGVYGLVAGIVRLDDMGLRLKNLKDDDLKNAADEMLKKESFENSPRLKKVLGPLFDHVIKPAIGLGMKAINEPVNLLKKPLQGLGGGMVSSMPYLMQGLTIAGTIAMFGVGGGLLLHNIPALGILGHGFLSGVAAAGLVGAGIVATEKAAHPLVDKFKDSELMKSIAEKVEAFKNWTTKDIDNDKELEKKLKVTPAEREILNHYLESEKKFQDNIHSFLKEDQKLAESVNSSKLREMVSEQQQKPSATKAPILVKIEEEAKLSETIIKPNVEKFLDLQAKGAQDETVSKPRGFKP